MATLSTPLAGTEGLTTTGPGTLALSGTNSYSGGTNVPNGTLQVPADAALGTGNVTGAALGTVNFTGTTTTAKSFAMNGGTVSIAAGRLDPKRQPGFQRNSGRRRDIFHEPHQWHPARQRDRHTVGDDHLQQRR